MHKSKTHKPAIIDVCSYEQMNAILDLEAKKKLVMV